MSILLFRQDFRIKDNPALSQSIKNSDSVTAVYVFDEESIGVRKIGGASKYWLHHSLKDIKKSLQQNYNINLIIRCGKTFDEISKIIAETGAEKIYFNRCYEDYNIQIENQLKSKFDCESFNASLLVESWEVKNGSGEFFKVYTHFYKKCLAEHKPREVIKAPEKQNKNFEKQIATLKIEDLNLLPTNPNWSLKFDKYWQISEEAMADKLYNFYEKGLKFYADNRNFPDDENSTSKISPYLHFGQVSPHQILQSIKTYSEAHRDNLGGADKYISEIYWREFSHNLLYNFKKLPEKNFRVEFDNFPWDENLDNLKIWQQGKTGFPIVDAGMRELYETGWMHNRVRMIVGSFLTKNLLLNWKNGEEWFWDTLLDADLANNSASWQWVAGSGADAAPYFRIFNPIMQAEKFDPKGNYIKKWLPELKLLPAEFLSKPWEAPELVLRSAGVELGKNYPKPIMMHDNSRERALKAYEKIKKSANSA
jgi:deoxyribodipyrimidine photo-lyase